MIRRILSILATPSAEAEPPHTRGAVAAWHAVAGMLAGIALSGLGWIGPMGAFVLVFAAYWWAKERGDLARGGGVADGIEDAVAVALGAWVGQTLGWGYWWPVLALNLLPLGVFAVGVWREGVR